MKCMAVHSSWAKLVMILVLCMGTFRIIYASEDSSPDIRQFPPETIERLGRELYQRDQLAWKATDALQAAYPESKSMALQGWITVLGEVPKVYFIRKAPGESTFELAYRVIFDPQGEVTVTPRLGEALPSEVARRFQARSTALEAMPGYYDRRYNIEVLNDPDGNGFLVYVMPATEQWYEVVIGGHVRITVSEDGQTAEAVDELSRSLLIIDKRQGEKGEKKVVATMVSHIVSKTPVEPHVFNSLLHETPIYVVTGPEETWMVQGDQMEKAELPRNE